MERILEELKAVNNIVPAVRSAGTVNGGAIDTDGYDEAAFVVNVGTIVNTNSDTTLDVKVQECDTSGGTYADITDAAITQLAYTDDDVIATINVRLGGRANRKRYVRAVGVVAGTDSAAYGVAAMLKAREKPVVNDPVSVLV